MAIKKFQDLQVEHPQRYEVTDNAGTENLKTIKFSPGKVYQEGTKETAVIFNNIQKNGLYTVIGTRVIEGTEEIYDVELEGLEEFGIFDINLQLVANSKNTTNSPKLRILNEKYSFVNNYGTISIGDLAVNNIYIVKIDTVKKTAFLTESDKLQKGTYPGKASDLKAEIDGKFSKSGGFLSGSISIRNDTNPVVNFDTATGSYQGFVGRQPDSIRLYNNISKKYISLGDDGVGIYPSTSLKTEAKDLSVAVNELLDNKLDKGDVSEDYNTGKKIVNKINGLAGGYSGTFPLTTAVKEGIYLLPATNKFYVCIKNYNGSSLTAPNANFEELSVYTNRKKIENLFEKNKFKPLKNFPLNTIKLSETAQYFSLTSEEANALEYLVLYDTDFSGSSRSKFIYGDLARSPGGEYWYQAPTGESIHFGVSGSQLRMLSTHGELTVHIPSIFYR